MAKARIGLIGCGGIGGYHLEHFLKFDFIDLVGVCDVIAERAEAFGVKAGCPAYTDYRDLLNQKPDAVFIGIPPYCHGEIEFEVIKRGIHMFVEKPVGLNPEVFLKIRDAAQKAGIITASGLQLRYESNLSALKDFAATHRIVQMNLNRVGGIPNTPWWDKRALSGGQIVEQTIHQFDMARYIMGEPVEVMTFGGRDIVTKPGFDTEDMSVTLVKFASGALGTITTGCYGENGACMDNKLTFGAINARADYAMFDKVAIYGNAAIEGSEVIEGDGRMVSGEDYVEYKPTGDCGILCDKTFIEAVMTKDASKIKSPYEDAVKSVEFTLACNRSMDTGRAVKI